MRILQYFDWWNCHMKGAGEEPSGAQCRSEALLPVWQREHTTGSLAEKQATLFRSFLKSPDLSLIVTALTQRGSSSISRRPLQAGIVCPQTPVVFSLFHWNNRWDLSSETLLVHHETLQSKEISVGLSRKEQRCAKSIRRLLEAALQQKKQTVDECGLLLF